ncbi:hypothetical protein IF1G_11160 [Cordyceps javanica]|uniref:Uncharacterized protein n=1 Tax=Cordyceps javanica TaxID=43265 RepID=A0A545UL21_9HYPO|nr:hypothetical protein IF1G_11160 [Cordyceps javanica]
MVGRKAEGIQIGQAAKPSSGRRRIESRHAGKLTYIRGISASKRETESCQPVASRMGNAKWPRSGNDSEMEAMQKIGGIQEWKGSKNERSKVDLRIVDTCQKHDCIGGGRPGSSNATRVNVYYLQQDQKWQGDRFGHCYCRRIVLQSGSGTEGTPFLDVEVRGTC